MSVQHSNMEPRTPARNRTRSEAKAPLTPSLISGINNISLNTSPVKRKGHGKSKSTSTSVFDVSNPFLAVPQQSRPASRAASPIKRVINGGQLYISEDLQRQAAEGVVRRGGIESRLDVVTMDYIPKLEPKRTKSTPALNREHGDRFITVREREPVAPSLDPAHFNAQSASPGHTARLIEATGVPLNRRVLGYREAPPLASTDKTLAQQREYAKPLYARPVTLASTTGSFTNKTRKIPTQPERVLDAPDLVDDFYLNLISWSCHNSLVVALDSSAYIWKADTGIVAQLGDAPSESPIACVEFSNDGMFLGVGNADGEVELWDVETGTKLRTMGGHQDKVATLSWHEHILSSGCGDGSIWHHDVRVPRHKVMELLGHTGEICGLKWRSDGELLASGGNDNVVNIWDGRLGDVGPDARGSAKWTKRNHTAAVKGLAWCPWQPNLLASGGGTNDAKIHIWNSTTGARLHTKETPAQITSVHWAPQRKEILTTHGYPTNSIMLHAYPSMERVAELRDIHDSRVLYSCVSPNGDVVCTGAGDQLLKFWRIWEGASEVASRKKKENDTRRMNSTNGLAMAIR